MIIESLDIHQTDKEFFPYIRLFNLLFNNAPTTSKDGHFSIYDIVIVSTEKEPLGYSFLKLQNVIDALGIKVTIVEDLFGLEKELSELKLSLDDQQNIDRRAKLTKILDSVEKNTPITRKDVDMLSLIWPEIYSYVTFTPSEYNIPKEAQAVYENEIDSYLDNFINDKLTITDKNHYRFERQKSELINIIEQDKKINLYGNNFILEERVDDYGDLLRNPDFSIVQTLYALQKLGYLSVVYAQRGISSRNRVIRANIVLKDVFIEEINANYKKENPKNVIEKFDDKSGTLSFAGQQIELSKKGKETDSVLLLKTLMKQEDDEWVHNDQILEDWGYNIDDLKVLPKNKAYFAASKINNAVALKTKIDDFIEYNTTKARINPKYRTVAE